MTEADVGVTTYRSAYLLAHCLGSTSSVALSKYRERIHNKHRRHLALDKHKVNRAQPTTLVTCSSNISIDIEIDPVGGGQNDRIDSSRGYQTRAEVDLTVSVRSVRRARAHASFTTHMDDARFRYRWRRLTRLTHRIVDQGKYHENLSACI